MPVQRAAEHCPWLKAMVEAGEIYHPLRWTAAEATQFLKDVPALERAGVIVRMPASWRMNRPARPQVKATVGGKAPSMFGLRCPARLHHVRDARWRDAHSNRDQAALLAQTDGLALIRGKWVEVDRERLGRTLTQFEEMERRAAPRACRSARRCGCWRAPGSGRRGRQADGAEGPDRRRALARRDADRCASPDGRTHTDPGRAL